jgi:hypothetical protein
MKRGSHAADDGSFNRSAAIHTGRAAVLLVVAFLIGVGLLHSADNSVTIGTTGTTAPKATTTTTVPQTTTTTLAPRDPSTVKVLPANGTATNGIGAKLRTKLLGANYDALTAVTSTSKLKSTVVYFTPGFQSEAAAVAVFLGMPATAVQAMPAKAPVPQLGTANILVVAGDDIVPTLASTTTTTVKATTGTTKKTTTTAKSSSSSSSSSTTATTAHSTTTTTKP